MFAKREVVRIAGAGLAGLTTAIGLAVGGRSVEVFEAGRESGWGRRGMWDAARGATWDAAQWDAVENWTTRADFLEVVKGWGVETTFERRPICEFEIYDDRGERFTIRTPRPIFYLVKRGVEAGSLEQALKVQAVGLGVPIGYGERRGRDEVEVWAAGAEHAGQFLGIGVTFKTKQADTFKVLVSSGHAPKAYAYLYIVEGCGTVSVTLTRDFVNARQYLKRSINFFRTVGLREMKDMRISSGFGGRKALFGERGNGPLRVGEAAGLQDYLWGFGIRQAMESGYLASQALITGSDYARMVDQQIGLRVRRSLINRAFYDAVGDRTYGFLIRRLAGAKDVSGWLRRGYGG